MRCGWEYEAHVYKYIRECFVFTHKWSFPHVVFTPLIRFRFAHRAFESLPSFLFIYFFTLSNQFILPIVTKAIARPCCMRLYLPHVHSTIHNFRLRSKNQDLSKSNSNFGTLRFEFHFYFQQRPTEAIFDGWHSVSDLLTLIVQSGLDLFGFS